MVDQHQVGLAHLQEEQVVVVQDQELVDFKLPELLIREVVEVVLELEVIQVQVDQEVQIVSNHTLLDQKEVLAAEAAVVVIQIPIGAREEAGAFPVEVPLMEKLPICR